MSTRRPHGLPDVAGDMIPSPEATEDLNGTSCGGRPERGRAMVRQAVSKSETLALLREHKPVLAERFGVVDLALFGSAARDEAGPDSDIDILVSYDRVTRSKQYFGALHYLEDLLGRPVDLVMETALRAELRPYVEAEAIHV